MAQATGESKVAKRYGYSQSPSIKVTGWLPIFPFLQLVISEHLETIINPKKIVENAVRWVDTFRKSLGLVTGLYKNFAISGSAPFSQLVVKSDVFVVGVFGAAAFFGCFFLGRVFPASNNKAPLASFGFALR